MKSANLVAKKILRIMGSAWRWLNCSILGILVGAGIMAWYYNDVFGIGLAQKKK